MSKERLPIIANGEKYIEPIIKKQNFGKKERPFEYEEAKVKIIDNLTQIESKIKNKTEFFMEDKVLCVRLEPKFEAKSYLPSSLAVSKDMKFIGGRKYTYCIDSETDEVKKAKLYFLKTNDIGINKLKEVLQTGLKDDVENWKKQIQSLNSIGLLDEAEKIQGFSDEWEKGSVEIVLHPLGEDNVKEMVDNFSEVSGIGREEMTVRSYSDGITFISTLADKTKIHKMKKFNPLRSVHPIGEFEIDPLRMRMPAVDGPQPPKRKVDSGIKIGVFDGGTDDNIPLLRGYVENHDEVEVKATLSSLRHGTGVCGAILYGHIGGKTPQDEMDVPYVSVESFRVLPEDKSIYQNDAEKIYGMYATIDTIERIVKKRKDIHLYNLSIGPKGPIIDDEISRFTYVLDLLTYDVKENEVNPLFCVAVGNDGDKGELLDRIQSPSDMVNGLSVGAYTYNFFDEKVRANYSCIGPGREGAKVKPDIVEFGGSQERPFIKVGLEGNTLEVDTGTSYATPLATGKIGRLMAQSDEITPHMGRTLLIHNAYTDNGVRDDEIGYGFSDRSPEDILSCEQNKVTILYQGELEAFSTAKLPIFAPFINHAKGNVNITWTITTIVNPDNSDVDAYTNNCIEDTLYPHSGIYKFTKDKSPDQKLNITKAEDAPIIEKLLQNGYKMSSMPVSASPKRNKSETELRNKDLKWDTVIKKNRSFRASSLFNPFITVHAIGRNGYEHEKIKYFIAITIEAPRYNGNLYDSIMQTYTNLVPIELRNINKLMLPLEQEI